MPELPEVEHAARSLRAWLTGVAVVRAGAPATRVFRDGSNRTFQRSLPGRTLARVERRGKVLLLFFDGDVGVLSHLGMTGKWVRHQPPSGDPAPRHSRASLALADGSAVHYCDPRMFGRLALHRAAELPDLPEVRALGPDPVADGIDAAALHAALSRTARAVKAALLDQKILAGVGNIYATEALFRARVHPARAGRSLSRREVERIARGLDDTFADALARLGGDMAYLSDGAHVENPFAIYDRAGEPCPSCRRALSKATIGGRTSAFCARCQK
ncbi:MAG: bifunctional DNA-formamidopyrimidine glycosylase/DNA-(apurinic or apyrimidinic site) lyase [Minicystis sp.]